MDDEVLIIGIDAATQPTKVGLARGTCSSNAGVSIEECRTCSTRALPAEIVAGWVRSAEIRPTVIAIDAPLGWPDALRTRLPSHRAGRTLVGKAEMLFCRRTDRRISARHDKAPMEVGAAWIARTARWALALLGEVERILERPVELAWDHERLPDGP